MSQSRGSTTGHATAPEYWQVCAVVAIAISISEANEWLFLLLLQFHGLQLKKHMQKENPPKTQQNAPPPTHTITRKFKLKKM